MPLDLDRTLHGTAPAKLNLYLEIVGKRADGYHELVSIMQTLDLADALSARLVRRAPGEPRVSVVLSGPQATPEIPTDARNLAVAAALAVLERAQVAPDIGIALTLEKHIPAAGGLGGGSSDAASALQLSNRLLDDTLTDTQLHEIAASLGSDINVFLVGGTVLALGRGERVRAVTPPGDFEATLMLPPFGARTPEVYAALNATPLPPDWSERAADARGDEIARRVAHADSDALVALFRNDLEHAARHVDTRLGNLLAAPRRRLCGSGSTLIQLGALDADTPRTCESKPIRFLAVRSRKR
ncbi:MAG: hypothetical protein DHS20C15_11020 [Planctomycetota bacterium]|nr:MAG: hypothetical protein DHS20C15_11020 [Planctomycetota bacterium]